MMLAGGFVMMQLEGWLRFGDGVYWAFQTTATIGFIVPRAAITAITQTESKLRRNILL